MIHYHMQIPLADVRRRDFLAQAEAARLSRQARLGRQRTGMPGASHWSFRWLRSMLRPGRDGVWRRPSAADGGNSVALLRDGSAVLVRPVRPADAPLLADAFTRLSLKSRQLRFLTAKCGRVPHFARFGSRVRDTPE